MSVRRMGFVAGVIVIALASMLLLAPQFGEGARVHAFLHALRNQLATQVSDAAAAPVTIPPMPNPFAAGAPGPLFQPLGPQPRLDPESDARLQPYVAQNPSFQPGWADNDPSQARYDYNHPIYRATKNDIRVTLHCTIHWNDYGCGVEGDTIFIPAQAQRAGGSDHHLAVIEPDGVTEYDLWAVAQDAPFASGQTLRFGGGNKLRLDGVPLKRTQPCQGQSFASENSCADIVPGLVGGGATAGGAALSLSQIYVSELRQGRIGHALFLGVACFNTHAVYPAPVAQSGQHICSGGVGIPVGSRVWYDLPPPQIALLVNLNDDQKTILRALHEYGAFVNDDGMNPQGAGTGFGTTLESQQAYWTAGKGDPVAAYARAHHWQHIVSGDVNRYLLEMDGPTIDFAHHLHLVAPCVSRQTC